MEENPSTPSCNMPQQRQQPEGIPNTPTFQVREDTPWPNTVPASTNLFEARSDWPILPLQTPTVKMEKADIPPRVAAIPHAKVLPEPQNNRPVEEKCTWGLHCPICKKGEEEGTEDWNADRQESHQRNHYPQNPQHAQTYDVPDRYSQQIWLQKEWNKKMEHLNEKYNLDYYSSSSLILTLSQNTNTKHLYKFTSFSNKNQNFSFKII